MDRRSVLDALLREDLKSFLIRTFLTIDRSQPYLDTWHLDLLADALMRAYRRETTRLIITLPPRSLKSIAASVAFPAWALGRNPRLKIVCASYAAELAAKHARDTRTVMQADWYRRIFPDTRLNPKKMSEEEFTTTTHGFRLATSVGGTLTGRGGNLIIIDDPIKAQDALSKVKRDSVGEWFDGTLYSRLDNKRDDVIVLVMQRVHLDDLAGRLLDRGGWEHVCLPAIAEGDETFVLSDGRRVGRRKGEALHPAREPLDKLAEARINLGAFAFSAQYQQCPVPEDGHLVSWDWFETADGSPVPAGTTVQSWDVAMTAGDGSDWSVCTTWRVVGERYDLLDVLRERLLFPELKRRVVAMARQFRADTVLIEEVGIGQGLIQQLRDEGQLHPIGCVPVGSKAARLAAQSAVIEARRVVLPKAAPWLAGLRAELVAFPHGRHDDQVDSLTQFLAWHGNRPRHEFW